VQETTTVDKSWGHELIWAKTDRYVGKILHVKAGEALSVARADRDLTRFPPAPCHKTAVLVSLRGSHASCRRR
jgi:hypothetical protein